MARFVVYRDGQDSSAGGRVLSYREWPAAEVAPAQADMQAVLTGENGAMFDATQRHTLLASVSPEVRVTAGGGDVARWLNLATDTNHADQPIESLRPAMRRNPIRIQGDGSDRIRVSFQSPIAIGQAWIDTPWGHFVSPISGSTYDLPIGGTRRAFLRAGALDDQEAELFARWAGSPRVYAVATMPGTSIDTLACTGVDGGTQVRFIGANGVETTKLIPYSGTLSANLAADGLAAPVVAVWPASLIDQATMRTLRIHNCGFSGAIGDISGHPMLESADFSGNRFSGSLPPLALNPLLTEFSAASNVLSGRIPDLGANMALTTFNVSDNLLTDFIGTIPASVVTFNAANNLLTQAAVDAILLALVSAGAEGGTVDLFGPLNAFPTLTGFGARSELLARGWTVSIQTGLSGGSED